MSCPYGSGLGWLCWRGVWGISQGPPHFLAHLASLFARWALWLEHQVGVEVHQQGWVVALPDMDVGQLQMKRGEVALAGAGFAGAFLRSVHLIQPHQGTRQLELAVPGVALQLESSASEWFGFGEAGVLLEKRGQGKKGQGIAALAEGDGFLEGFLREQPPLP